MKEEEIQFIFKILLYCFILPYLFYISYINKNKIVLLCASCIIIAHIYRDVFNPLWSYSGWIRFLGTFCAFLIFKYGDNNYIKLIGLLKIIGDIRKYVFKSDKYYF